MLIDEAQITVSGGHGGPGKASFFHKGRGPDGGNGGNGGDVYFETTSDLTAMARYASKKSFKAPDGEPGRSNKKAGANADDITLLVPVGTDLIDEETGEVFGLDKLEEKILICRGGEGGLGNADRANARMTTPYKAQPGLPGQERRLKLVLKLIADYGLVGLPNAGKSSLLNALTNASAKVGDYPFTTLEPNLGVSDGKVIADIPGLIEGASKGKGLGDRFLKHIEKVPVILHCIAADSADPRTDYTTIRKELEQYNPALLDKKEIIIMTKSDLGDNPKLKKLAKGVITVSVLDDESLQQLKKTLSDFA